jgi:hypothetical protein
MKAAQQPAGDPDSPLHYSTLWLECIDRGGLYHISDDVFMVQQKSVYRDIKTMNIEPDMTENHPFNMPLQKRARKH